MKLVLDIALTHVRSRLRQTLVGLMGVAMGVGFSVMMAALMEGSQRDFVTPAGRRPAAHHHERRAPRAAASAGRGPSTLVVAFSGLSTMATRPGIKNPYAIIASLDSWLDGAVAPSVQARAVIRYAGRDTAANVTGIDPKREVARLEAPDPDCAAASSDALYRSSNAIILGDRLAPEDRRPRRQHDHASFRVPDASLSCTVVALLHSGISQTDETQAYTLIKTAQILAGQTGIVNAMRIRVADIMQAHGCRQAASRRRRATNPCPGRRPTRTCCRHSQIRNFIMYTVVGAILLVASFGTYNIISTITHEKTRDIAILKSLGFTESTVRSIFLIEALIIGLAGTLAGWVLGYVLCLRTRHRSSSKVLSWMPRTCRSTTRPRTTCWPASSPSQPLASPAICPPARLRASTRSRSSGEPHDDPAPP